MARAGVLRGHGRRPVRGDGTHVTACQRQTKIVESTGVFSCVLIACIVIHPYMCLGTIKSFFRVSPLRIPNIRRIYAKFHVNFLRLLNNVEYCKFRDLYCRISRIVHLIHARKNEHELYSDTSTYLVCFQMNLAFGIIGLLSVIPVGIPVVIKILTGYIKCILKFH